MRPLSHLTVLDLTVNVPGPFCSMILADMGARVIKVEPPGGDPLRHSPGMWASLNRGKQSVVLDLKTEGARELLGRLAMKTDSASTTINIDPDGSFHLPNWFITFSL